PSRPNLPTAAEQRWCKPLISLLRSTGPSSTGSSAASVGGSGVAARLFVEPFRQVQALEDEFDRTRDRSWSTVLTQQIGDGTVEFGDVVREGDRVAGGNVFTGMDDTSVVERVDDTDEVA